MSGWNHSGIVWKPRYCCSCGKEFSPRSGVHKFCSLACKGKWKYITGQLTTETQYKKISGNWERYFSRLCNRSRKREDISVQDCLELLKEQDYKCALSGIKLTCSLEKGIKFKTNASLDRIKAGGPYIKENVQLVCSVLNCWRSDTEVDEFIWWCAEVTKHQKGER